MEPTPWEPPALRPQPAVPAPRPEPEAPRPPAWHRLIRTPRAAAGFAIAAAALLLWPFSGWSWLPWLAGLLVLVLLRLLRLDGLLRGWVLHVGGLVVVAGLMISTGPWAWAAAASIGVLIAGLVQLPAWRLAAVGAVLCVISGVGLGFTSFESREERRQEQVQAGDQVRPELGTDRYDTVLRALMGAVADDNPTRFCALLVVDAETQFVESSGSADCASAVGRLAAQVRDPAAYEEPTAPITAVTGAWLVDACATQWEVPAAGPQLGELRVEQTQVGGAFVVAGFRPC